MLQQFSWFSEPLYPMGERVNINNSWVQNEKMQQVVTETCLECIVITPKHQQQRKALRNPFSANRPGAGPMRARRNPTRAPGPRYPVTGLRFCTALPAAAALLYRRDVPKKGAKLYLVSINSTPGPSDWTRRLVNLIMPSRWKKSWILIGRP